MGDLRYALRGLLRSPGFTAAAVLALALGIGATTAIFSAVNAALLRSSGWSHESRLVAVRSDFPGHRLYGLPVSPPEYQDLRDSKLFENVGVYTQNQSALQRETAERVEAAFASSTFFATLGVVPLYGRTFTAAEDLAGNEGVAILTEESWRKRFGADSAVIGKSVTIDGLPRTIVGILPASFRYDTAQDFYLPIGFTPEQLTLQRSSHNWDAVARMKPGMTADQARAQLQTFSDQLRAAHKETYSKEAAWRFSAAPLRNQLLGSARDPLLLLFAAVLMVLLIACANVANLLLARSAAREREFAVRGALGAGRARIIRQVLTESALLAFAGAALGLAIAAWGLDALLATAPDAIRSAGVKLDKSVLAFAAIAAGGTALLFGIAPAVRSSGASLYTPTIGGKGKLRAVLVAGQVALCIVLLCCAGLLLRSFARLVEVPLGFEPKGVITAQAALAGPAYDTHDDARRNYFRRALRAVSALPGVEVAGAADVLPITGGGLRSYQIENYQRRPGEPNPASQLRAVTPRYFQTLRMQLVAGRDLTDADDDRTAGAVVVNQAWVRRYSPGKDPLGTRVRLWMRSQGHGESYGEWRTIVGVVGDAREAGIDEPMPPALYLPFAQNVPGSLTFAVRAPSSVAPQLRQTLASLDSTQAVDAVHPYEQLAEDSLAPRRFPLQLLGAFAALALVLASLGIYGVTSYSVAQRNREIAVRMAVGASREGVLRLVLLSALRTVGVGALLGLCFAAVSARLVQSLLFGISAFDPLTYSGIVVVLALTALAASALPALRASRIDPMTALRGE
jgi:predicted permease